MKPIKEPESFIQTAGERAAAYAIRYHGCAQATLAAFQELLDFENEDLLAAASCFVGGSCLCLYCGPLAAGFMVFGVMAGRRRLADNPENLDRALEPARELYDRFLKEYPTTNCCELTGFDMRDPAQRELFFQSNEGTDNCTERIRNTTEWIAEILLKMENRQ